MLTRLANIGHCHHNVVRSAHFGFHCDARNRDFDDSDEVRFGEPNTRNSTSKFCSSGNADHWSEDDRSSGRDLRCQHVAVELLCNTAIPSESLGIEVRCVVLGHHLFPRHKARR